MALLVPRLNNLGAHPRGARAGGRYVPSMASPERWKTRRWKSMSSSLYILSPVQSLMVSSRLTRQLSAAASNQTAAVHSECARVIWQLASLAAQHGQWVCLLGSRAGGSPPAGQQGLPGGL